MRRAAVLAVGRFSGEDEGGDDGTFTWTMPTGRRYVVRPPDREHPDASTPDPPF